MKLVAKFNKLIINNYGTYKTNINIINPSPIDIVSSFIISSNVD